jgi:hypothetical protein
MLPTLLFQYYLNVILSVQINCTKVFHCDISIPVMLWSNYWFWSITLW